MAHAATSRVQEHIGDPFSTEPVIDRGQLEENTGSAVENCQCAYVLGSIGTGGVEADQVEQREHHAHRQGVGEFRGGAPQRKEQPWSTLAIFVCVPLDKIAVNGTGQCQVGTYHQTSPHDYCDIPGSVTCPKEWRTGEKQAGYSDGPRPGLVFAETSGDANPQGY